MYIIAGTSRIEADHIIEETRYYKELGRPGLRVRLSSGLSPADLENLQNNDWRLVSFENGKDIELSIQKGFNTLECHEVTFVKMDVFEAKNIALKEEVAAFSSAVPILLKGRNDDTIAQFAKYIPRWVEGSYANEDLRTNTDGYPFRCAQAHDSTGNPAWDTTVASLWVPYHAKSAEYALPFIAPTGAHDMYKKNEYMLFTDEKIYQCAADTAYSPTDYPQAWEVV